jgi:hypothetical protein
MKLIFPLYFIAMILGSCDSNEPVKSEAVIVSPTLIPSPEIKKDSLTAGQIEKIEAFYSKLKEVCGSSLEEMISNFKKDPNTDVEIASWTRIANAYQKCIHIWNYKPTLEMKKEIFQLMLNRSMTSDEEAIKSVKPVLLSEKEIQVVLTFYITEPDSFDEQGK